MGSLIKIWKTVPMPTGAKIGRSGTVTWTAKGKKRTGKMSTIPGRVTVQSDTWTAQFTDEHGKMQRVSTKTTVRSVAEKILVRYQTEVDRIRTGVATRDELSRIHFRLITFEKALEQYRTKMIADGSTPGHIKETIKKIIHLCHATGIESLQEIRRETVERWIADEVQKKAISLATINHYVKAMKSFVQYLVDIEYLSSHPLKSVRKLNEALDHRKKRRAMTTDEVDRLLQTAVQGNSAKTWRVGERVLVYRLLLGTGLRSTELSLLTPSQIDFERNRLRIEAAKTKNRKADVLPMRPDLVLSVKEWVSEHSIHSHERIFRFNKHTIREVFYKDLAAAGIERQNSDGRSLDVHALRKTFGTMLAKAGVPLTTTQRLMRHYSPVLTAKLYIDVDPVDMMQALEQLPALSTVSLKSPKQSPKDSN
jgi:integrase